MSTISRRGFLGLVAGALAACKLIAPREHQLVEQVEGKAAPQQPSVWVMDNGSSIVIDEPFTVHDLDVRPPKVSDFAPSAPYERNLTPAAREYVERINRELNAQTHDEHFEQYQRIKARKLAEWHRHLIEHFEQELWSA